MKTKKSILTVAMIALFAIATIGVYAQDTDSTPPPPPPPKHEKKCKKPSYLHKGKVKRPHHQRQGMKLPGLNEAQKEEMKKADLKNLKAMTSLKNQIREKHAHLVTLLSSDDLDMKDVNNTIDQIGDLNSRMLKLQVSHHRAVRDLLTSDQKVLFDAKPKPFLRK